MKFKTVHVGDEPDSRQNPDDDIGRTRMRIVDENTGSGFELRFRDNGEFPDVICINPNRPFSHLRKVGHISAHPDEVDNFFAPNDKFQHSPFALRQLASLVMAWQGNTEPL